MNASLTCRVWLGMLALGLSACQPSGAQDPRPAPAPPAQDIASAYHPTYKAAAGTRSECLGRLAFEIPAKPAFEWGLPRGARTNEENLGFSRILNGGQDASVWLMWRWWWLLARRQRRFWKCRSLLI